MEPLFPLTIRFADGETQTVQDREDAACNLEWFDSDDPQEPAQVTDSAGRSVRLKVERLAVVLCELR